MLFLCYFNIDAQCLPVLFIAYPSENQIVSILSNPTLGYTMQHRNAKISVFLVFPLITDKHNRKFRFSPLNKNEINGSELVKVVQYQTDRLSC